MTNQQKDSTRKRLIALCEQGIVQVDKWMDRDTPATQQQLGICWAYLKAGCNFTIISEEEEFLYLTIFHPTFRTIESQHPGEPEELESTDFYIPTERKIKECKGRDWY
jgi:hypothetical protein